MPRFINPYNFVSFDESRIAQQRTQPIVMQHRLDPNRLSGRLRYHLTTLTHVFTPLYGYGGEEPRSAQGNQTGEAVVRIFNRLKNDENALPMIQGASLKGVIRSVAEAVSNSCFTMFSGDYRYRVAGGRWKTVELDETNLPEEMQIDACTLPSAGETRAGLCICCHLFGTSPTQEDEPAFGGQIAIGDALLMGVDTRRGMTQVNIQNIAHPDVQRLLFEVRYLQPHTLSNPKPHHDPFYLYNDQIRGRKFYLHHSQIDDSNLMDVATGQREVERRQRENRERQRRGKRPLPLPQPLQLLKPNAVFGFTVEYRNLTASELGLLCLALQLEDGVCHKIGHGKPIGLGSARIDIVGVEEVHVADRWRNLGGGMIHTDDPTQVRERVKGWTDAFQADPVHFYDDGWEDLKAILRWEPDGPKTWNPHYPTRDWFKDKDNRGRDLPHPRDLQDEGNRFKE